MSDDLLMCRLCFDLTCFTVELCCNSVECWAFASRGLATVGQDEVFFCLDCSSLERPPTVTDDGGEKGSATTTVADADLPDFPRDVFRLFTAIYDSASKGWCCGSLKQKTFT